MTFLAVVLGGAFAVTSACSDDDGAASPAADGGANEAAVAEGICPSAPPASGETCLVPEGTTCAFSACGSAIAQCLRGVWSYSGNPVPRPPCPDPNPPASESACPPCWPAGVTCRYGSEDCSSPDASANQTVASCANGSWVLSFSPCAPTDAGADVQRDARAEAD